MVIIPTYNWVISIIPYIALITTSFHCAVFFGSGSLIGDGYCNDCNYRWLLGGY